VKTSKQRKAEFLAELNDLLSRHGAELQITDDGKDYGMHTGTAIVTMPAKWSDNGDLTHDYTEFELPNLSYLIIWTESA